MIKWSPLSSWLWCISILILLMLLMEKEREGFLRGHAWAPIREHGAPRGEHRLWSSLSSSSVIQQPLKIWVKYIVLELRKFRFFTRPHSCTRTFFWFDPGTFPLGLTFLTVLSLSVIRIRPLITALINIYWCLSLISVYLWQKKVTSNPLFFFFPSRTCLAVPVVRIRKGTEKESPM